MKSDQDPNKGENDQDDKIRWLIHRLREVESRVERLEKEMSAIGRMEGAIKNIFGSGDEDEEVKE